MCKTGGWCQVGKFIDQYNIGLEGGSAWAWIKYGEEWECVGVTATSSIDAVLDLVIKLNRKGVIQEGGHNVVKLQLEDGV